MTIKVKRCPCGRLYAPHAGERPCHQLTNRWGSIEPIPVSPDTTNRPVDHTTEDYLMSADAPRCDHAHVDGGHAATHVIEWSDGDRQMVCDPSAEAARRWTSAVITPLGEVDGDE